jgi:predicted lipoprotein with Yx(FWY)xxD motif
MKSTTTLVAAALLAAASSAFAAKSCDELKTEIAAKLDAKNVTGYTLEIVEADKAGDAKVVGSCEGGAKKITYTRK